MKRFLIVATFTASIAAAQWLNYPTPGIPRTADGKPNLTAPAPRAADGKPDLSGVWMLNSGFGYSMNIASDVRPEDVLPWAAKLYQQRLENLVADDPESVACLPRGPRFITGGLGPLAKIIQTPTLAVVLGESLEYRQIFLDGRDLPKDPNPSFMGYSVGHWEGDTLVVVSTGFSDRTWLDFGGHPHTEALRMTERWRRRDFGHIDLQLTLEDPGAYAKPWTIPVEVTLRPDTDLLEYVCNENQKDATHLVGRTAEDRKITVAPAVLSRYVGRYEVLSPTSGALVRNSIDVALPSGRLLLDVDGKGKIPLFPMTDSSFTTGVADLEFVRDGQGKVMNAIFGMLKLVRKPE